MQRFLRIMAIAALIAAMCAPCAIARGRNPEKQHNSVQHEKNAPTNIAATKERISRNTIDTTTTNTTATTDLRGRRSHTAHHTGRPTTTCTTDAPTARTCHAIGTTTVPRLPHRHGAPAIGVHSAAF